MIVDLAWTEDEAAKEYHTTMISEAVSNPFNRFFQSTLWIGKLTKKDQ